MSKKKFHNVLVVLGGTSGERSVSLESGRACIKALKKKKYKVSIFDPKNKNFNLINNQKIDVIFNALHGRDGEDGVAQSYFEYLKIPYTHSGVISSHNAMNKIISKEIFKRNKIKSPNYFNFVKNEFNKNKLNKIIKKKKLVFQLLLNLQMKAQALELKYVKIC